jgi:hypothetical protein
VKRIALIIFLFISGCISQSENNVGGETQQAKYVCPDGSIVSSPESCPKTTTTVKPEILETRYVCPDGSLVADSGECPTTATLDESEKTTKSKVKIEDIFPKKGESVCGLMIAGFNTKSGSLEEAAIDYYPEEVTIWSEDVVIWGMRFSDVNDAKKYMTYLSNKRKTNEEIPDITDVSFGEWTGEKYTWKTPSGSYWKGKTVKLIMVQNDEYVLCPAVSTRISYAEEKTECVINILIERYEKALW